MAKGPLRRKAKQYNNDPANAADRMAKAFIFFFFTATVSRTMRAWPLICPSFFVCAASILQAHAHRRPFNTDAPRNLVGDSLKNVT